MIISVIIGSTRQGRFSEKPAQWILQEFQKRPMIEARLLDFRDFPMPFFDQPLPPAMPGRPPYEHDVVKKWTEQIAASDGRANPEFYDRMMRECYRGGLKSPRIVQEGVNEPTILSLVSTGIGVGWVLATARWRCPETVVVLRVVDLNVPLTLALAWRKDNTSPLLANFIGEIQRLPDVRAVNKD